MDGDCMHAYMTLLTLAKQRYSAGLIIETLHLLNTIDQPDEETRCLINTVRSRHDTITEMYTTLTHQDDTCDNINIQYNTKGHECLVTSKCIVQAPMLELLIALKNVNHFPEWLPWISSSSVLHRIDNYSTIFKLVFEPMSFIKKFVSRKIIIVKWTIYDFRRHGKDIVIFLENVSNEELDLYNIVQDCEDGRIDMSAVMITLHPHETDETGTYYRLFLPCPDFLSHLHTRILKTMAHYIIQNSLQKWTVVAQSLCRGCEDAWDQDKEHTCWLTEQLQGYAEGCDRVET